MDRQPNKLKRSIAVEMRKEFGTDERRIVHALGVLSFAEKMLPEEPGDSEVVVATALLHDTGIHEAEKKWDYLWPLPGNRRTANRQKNP